MQLKFYFLPYCCEYNQIYSVSLADDRNKLYECIKPRIMTFLGIKEDRLKESMGFVWPFICFETFSLRD